MKYFNIGTKIFLLTIRRQLSEFLTVFNTDFAYLYFHRNCTERRGHKETPLKTSFINCRHFKVSVSFLLYWSIHLIQGHRSRCTDTPSKMPNVSLSPLYSSIDSTFGTQRKLCRRAQRRRFIFQLYTLFPEALHPTQEQLWVLITSGRRLRSPAIKDVTHNNPHGSFLFNFFFFLL